MFEATVAIAHRHDQKPVFPHRCGGSLGFEQANLDLANFLQICTKPRHVCAVATGDRDVVCHPAGIKRGVSVSAHFDRMVDEFIVICSGKGAELFGENW